MAGKLKKSSKSAPKRELHSGKKPPIEAKSFDTSSIKAVVFDTNAFGEKGAIDLRLLERWRQLAEGEDLEIWLPEPVVWEAAIHAAEHAAEHRAFLKKSVPFMKRAG